MIYLLPFLSLIRESTYTKLWHMILLALVAFSSITAAYSAVTF